ncbi:MAG: metallophosphoesterase, partial [Burkholderiales bacterium]|nr:metallophosphoesterase [Phycisphaerae bacterium]
MLAMLAADLWWWWVSDRLARRAGVRWRIAANVFMAITVLGLFLLVFARVIRMKGMIMPELGVVWVYIWHLLVLPLITLPSLFAAAVRAVTNITKRARVLPEQPDPGRRAFLAQVIVAGPPVLAMGMLGKTVIDADSIGVRRTDLALQQLPRELDGTTIAFVSDPHVGSFMSDRKFADIIRLTNELDADLVLHGGDLINHSLKDLPDGIEMLQKMHGRYGVYGCQGNHDCIESRGIFERDTVRSGVQMLLDEVR